MQNRFILMPGTSLFHLANRFKSNLFIQSRHSICFSRVCLWAHLSFLFKINPVFVRPKASRHPLFPTKENYVCRHNPCYQLSSSFHFLTPYTLLYLAPNVPASCFFKSHFIRAAPSRMAFLLLCMAHKSCPFCSHTSSRAHCHSGPHHTRTNQNASYPTHHL